LLAAGSASAAPDAKPASCSVALHEGTVVRDHTDGTSAECAATIAEHNKKTLLASMRHASANALHDARAAVSSWERFRLGALHAAASRDFDQAKDALSKATGDAKAGAQAALGKAAQQADQVVDDAEKHAGELAAEAKKEINDRLNVARTRVEDAKKALQHGAARVKEELEAKLLRAEVAAKHLETMLGQVDLTFAERKLNLAAHRLGDEAKAIEGRARAEYDQAKQKVQAVEQRVKSEIASAEDKVKGIEKKLHKKFDDVKDHLTDLGHHIQDQIGNLKKGISNEVGQLAGKVKHKIKDLFDHLW
jgi:hypothetical protein